jgi:hypothetical protein
VKLSIIAIALWLCSEHDQSSGSFGVVVRCVTILAPLTQKPPRFPSTASQDPVGRAMQVGAGYRPVRRQWCPERSEKRQLQARPRYTKEVATTRQWLREASGAAMLPRGGLFVRASAKYIFKNLFQNSIDFTQREYRFAIFK